jgi:hypothetical protein
LRNCTLILVDILVMATNSSDEEATVSLPSLAFVAVLGFIIYRYFTSSSRSTTASPGRVAGQRFSAAQVEQITAMFPQLNRRDIMWDLQRNGGSVAATTERILGGGGLSPVCCHAFDLTRYTANTMLGTTLVSTYDANSTNNIQYDLIFDAETYET